MARQQLDSQLNENNIVVDVSLVLLFVYLLRKTEKPSMYKSLCSAG